MNFDDELLEKAQASGTWADFSEDDVLAKSAERMNMMKSSSKKDLSKLVPVQKQVTRNGKQVTQTVWVKPGSDEAKEAKQPEKADKKEDKKSESPLVKETQAQIKNAKQAMDDALKNPFIQQGMEDTKEAWGYSNVDETNMFLDMASELAADPEMSTADAFNKVKDKHPEVAAEMDNPNVTIENAIDEWGDASSAIEDYVGTGEDEDEDEEIYEEAEELIEGIQEALAPLRDRF